MLVSQDWLVSNYPQNGSKKLERPNCFFSLLLSVSPSQKELFLWLVKQEMPIHCVHCATLSAHIIIENTRCYHTELTAAPILPYLVETKTILSKSLDFFCPYVEEWIKSFQSLWWKLEGILKSFIVIRPACNGIRGKVFQHCDEKVLEVFSLQEWKNEEYFFCPWGRNFYLFPFHV